MSSIVVNYWYEGRSPQTGEALRLPRTSEIEAIARDLMNDLAADSQYSREGKMYGVLLVQTQTGARQILKAFSGLLNGAACVEGWVPPIEGRDAIAIAQTETLMQLDRLKQEIIDLNAIPERQEYEELNQKFKQELETLAQHHQQQKQYRQHQRGILLQTLSDQALKVALIALDNQSRLEGIDRRNLKRDRDAILTPLKQAIDQADDRIRTLKQRRKLLSKTLQAQMHRSYRLTNFAGQSRSLEDLLGSMPTGTGECCAPKLLHYAATHNLKPLAMAEFWWGAATGDRIPGEFYPACVDRCQPLMGFLLSGLMPRSQLEIVYEDDWLIVVNKPSGLLSVPGRYRDVQDSVKSRLSSEVWAVHRLDQDTSGLIIFARNAQTHRQLNDQFQRRQVEKIYEAVLSSRVTQPEGCIDLPLCSDRENRPRQKVDWQFGKPSFTRYRVLSSEDLTRIEFFPTTGRTHQLRVHAACGLGAPILGDAIYGKALERLYLHARELRLIHPQTGQTLHLRSDPPF